MPRPKKVFTAPLQTSSNFGAGNKKIQSNINQIQTKNGVGNDVCITKNQETKTSNSTNQLDENQNVKMDNLPEKHLENDPQNFNNKNEENKINGINEGDSFHIDLTKDEFDNNNNIVNPSEDATKSASGTVNGNFKENLAIENKIAHVPEKHMKSPHNMNQSKNENNEVLNSVPKIIFNSPLLENCAFEDFNERYNLSQNETVNNQQSPLSSWDHYATKLPDSGNKNKKILRKRKITNKQKVIKPTKEITTKNKGRPRKNKEELTDANKNLYDEDLKNKAINPVLGSSNEQMDNTSSVNMASSGDFLSHCSGISKDSKKTARKRLYADVNCDNLPSIKKSLKKAERNVIQRRLMSQDCHVVKPPQRLSQAEKLLWLQENRTIGLWVECCHKNCQKWRYLKDIVDPLDVPKIWYCCMNTDSRYNSCSAEQCLYFGEEDLIENVFTAGSLVWAKLAGYPWWPAMVDDNPEFLTYYWPDPDNKTPTVYNVTFFDSREVSRSWIDLSNIKKFNKVNVKNYIKNQPLTYRYRLLKSLTDATTAMKMSVRERLSKFSFVKRFKGPIFSYKHKINEFVEENNLPPFVDSSPSESQVSENIFEDEVEGISERRMLSSQNDILVHSPASKKCLYKSNRKLKNNTEVTEKAKRSVKNKIKEPKSKQSPRNISKTKRTAIRKKSVAIKNKSVCAKNNSDSSALPINNDIASPISKHCSQLSRMSQTSQKSVTFNKVVEFCQSSPENEEITNKPQDNSQNVDDNSPKNTFKIEQNDVNFKGEHVSISECEKFNEDDGHNETKSENECSPDQDSQHSNCDESKNEQNPERNELNSITKSDNTSLLTSNTEKETKENISLISPENTNMTSINQNIYNLENQVIKMESNDIEGETEPIIDLVNKDTNYCEIVENKENIHDSIVNTISNKSLDISRNLNTSLNTSGYISFEKEDSDLSLKKSNLKRANSENNVNFIRPRKETSELFGKKSDDLSSNNNLFLTKLHMSNLNFMMPLSSVQNNNNNLPMSSPCSKFKQMNDSVSSKHSDLLNSSMTSYREKDVSLSQNTNILTQLDEGESSDDSNPLDLSQEY